MVLFNAPMPVENHELRAVQLAVAMREALTVLSAGWRKRGHARLCGEAKDKQILIPPRILAKVEGHVEMRALGEFTLKGFRQPFTPTTLSRYGRKAWGKPLPQL